MQRRVFDRFGMANTSMMWRQDFARLADGWMADGKVEPHDDAATGRAAGSMGAALPISPSSPPVSCGGKAQAGVARGDAEAQLPITSRSQFPQPGCPAPPAERWKNLAAGLGPRVPSPARRAAASSRAGTTTAPPTCGPASKRAGAASSSCRTTRAGQGLPEAGRRHPRRRRPAVALGIWTGRGLGEIEADARAARPCRRRPALRGEAGFPQQQQARARLDGDEAVSRAPGGPPSSAGGAGPRSGWRGARGEGTAST